MARRSALAREPEPESEPRHDTFGRTAFDPTENVKSLNEASVKRQDDLSTLREKWDADRFRFLEKQMELRDRRQDDLRTQEAQHYREISLEKDKLRVLQAEHFKEITAVHAAYEAQLRIAETARIDAIRAVDVAAVQRAAEVSNTQAATLAAQVQTSAEALRNQQTAYAAQVDAKLAQVLDPVQADIRDLRKTQSEQIGAKETKGEGRQTNQWTIGIILAVVFFLSNVIVRYLPPGGPTAAP